MRTDFDQKAGQLVGDQFWWLVHIKKLLLFSFVLTVVFLFCSTFALKQVGVVFGFFFFNPFF